MLNSLGGRRAQPQPAVAPPPPPPPPMSSSSSSSSLSSSLSSSSAAVRRTPLDPRVLESIDQQASARRGFISRVKSSSFYTPLLFASFGGLLGGILCNWHYVENPPKSCGSDQACAKDRRERTMTAFLVGAILGACVYLYFFVRNPSSSAAPYEFPEAREQYEDDDNDDGMAEQFDFDDGDYVDGDDERRQ